MNLKKAFFSFFVVCFVYFGFIFVFSPKGLALSERIYNLTQVEEVEEVEEVEQPIVERSADSKPIDLAEAEARATEDFGNTVKKAEEDLGQTVQQIRADFQRAVSEASGK